MIATSATAATITITLDSVPSGLGCDTGCLCDTNWVVSGVDLRVTSTTDDDECTTNTCKWENRNNFQGPVYDKGIWLNPGRIFADLSDIDDPITQIRVDLEDYCPTTGCSSAAIYDGSTRVKFKSSQTDNGPINGPGYFIFSSSDIGNNTIDKLIVASCNGHI